jgi:uncharacterized protein RhaS with RHS repeats
MGNAITLTYDSTMRIVAITDAIGQVTTLEYGNTADSFKITKVTDPFGRSATFDYNSSNLISLSKSQMSLAWPLNLAMRALPVILLHR